MKERYAAVGLSSLTIFFAIAALWTFYAEHTMLIPRHGGTYREAIVGEPQFINPVLAGINAVDRDIIALVYSGLLKYDAKGQIIPDLAARYDVSEDGKEYTFFLRNNIVWHDGKPFTADDVIFTFAAVADPRYGSPQRAGLQGVTAEKIDDATVKIMLPYPHTQFLDKLTIGVIPKHIWEGVNPRNANLADANLEPIGTGPYQFVKFTKDKYGTIGSFTLAANDRFYAGAPFIDGIEFRFYQTDAEALDAYQTDDVMGFGGVAPKDLEMVKKRGGALHASATSKYFAVFFDQSRSKPLADKRVREALWRATDREAIIRDALSGNGVIADSPILSWLSGANPDIPGYPYSQDDARKLLDDAGWKDKDENGVREKIVGKDKEATDLKITLVASDSPELITVQEMLKKQWEEIGVSVVAENYILDEVKQKIIKPRKYEALIFGAALTQYPDPYQFWHSSQKKDPGLNLALYDNKDADQLLEKARDTASREERDMAIKKFQDSVFADIPALFLYSPSYVYAVDSDVKGIALTAITAPARRFSEIGTWYIKTERVKKTE